MKEYLEIGDIVEDSPVGSGEITDFTDRGYPRVNNIAVAWLKLKSGDLYDPHGHRKFE